MSNAVLEYKEWDSVFFKQDIYHLDPKNLAKVNQEIFSGLNNALVQIKIGSHDLGSLDLLQHLRFDFVEAEVTFEHSISLENRDRTNVILLQQAVIDDIPAIQQLILSSFTHSRYRSPWFQGNDFSHFYAEWGRKAVLNQYDDVCLTIKKPYTDTTCGIISAKRINTEEARIGLICVAKEHQGKNIGSELLEAIDYWCFTQGIKKIHLSTQASNEGACQFYLRRNYHFNKINYWFYKRVF